MKNILKFLKSIITATLCIALLYSCIDDFKVGNAALDKPQGVELNLDTIYSRKDLAERALWSLYHYTPTIYAIYRQQYNAEQYEVLSDCIHSVLGWGWMNEAWYNSRFGPASNEYQTRFGYNDSHCFEGMRAGYIFLENIDRVPDLTDPEKARMKAEAKVIIAGLNWLMFRQFGGIPLVKKVYSPDDDVNAPRASIEEMYNYMMELLDEAIDEPELKWNLPPEEQSEFWGRITKAAAVGQKMLIQLFAASPLFNDDQPYCGEPSHPANAEKLAWWGEKKPELWVALKETCEFFISQNAANGNPFGLVQPQTRDEAGYMAGFRDAYWNRGPVRGVNELVYVHLDNYYQGPTWWDTNFHGGSASWGNQCPTAEFMEMFPWADGAPFDTTGLYAYNVNPTVEDDAYDVPDKVKNKTWTNIYDGRDPRLYETIWVQKRGQIWKDGVQIQSWPGGNHLIAEGDGNACAEAWSHGICNAKWVMNHNRSLSRQRPYSWPILRMGGFHLIYAEALAETGDLSGAAAQVNLVRNRVGLGPIESFIPDVLTDKDVMISEILRERACELGYEDTRFTDMCRRKLHFDLSKPLHGVWTLRIDGVAKVLGDGEPYPDLWYDKRVITKAKPRDWWGTAEGWNTKLYLICLPQDEINKGYGLIQNPGW